MLPQILLWILMAIMATGCAAFSVQSAFLLVPLTGLLYSGLAHAANNILMDNHCPYDLYFWTVGPAGSGFNGTDHEVLTISANSRTIHGMINTEAIHGGISLKIRDLPRYQVAPAGIIQVEYNLEPSKNDIWYDLSAIDCNRNLGPEDPSFCPLIQGGMKIYVPDADEKNCPPAWCDATGCYNTYTEHGFWKGEPSFRCDAGVDIMFETCTESAGPRTFNGQLEPGLPVEPAPDSTPGQPTQDGICGAQSPGGLTCSGYANGNCCSSYGFCGFSELYCGDGCQTGFGDCSGSSPAYQPPAVSSTARLGSSVPTPSSVQPTSSYTHSTSSYVQPTQTHIEHTWPAPSDSEPTRSQVYTPAPEPNHTAPTHSVPSHSQPAHAPKSSSPLAPPQDRTVYTTHTVTESHVQATKTVTVIKTYHAPTPASPYQAPVPTKKAHRHHHHHHHHTAPHTHRSKTRTN